MNFKNLISYIFFFLIIGCEKQNTNNIDSNDITVDTSNYEEQPFYYNLHAESENSLNWNISLQEIMVTLGTVTASMPTIITNSSTVIGIENQNSYDDLIYLPENIEWFADTTLLSYGGDNVVLDYQFTCENPTHYHPNIHKILVWDYVYLFKIIETEYIYKIAAEKAKNNVFLQILAKKAKKSDFFLDIYFKSTIIFS